MLNKSICISWLISVLMLSAFPYALAQDTGGAETAAQNEAPSEGLEEPEEIGDVQAILSDTLLQVWRDFIGHLPFLVAGVFLMLATWGASALAARIARRVVNKARLRRSLRDLIVKLTSISIWLIGLLLTAMVVFPGLTPARALGGLGLVSLAVGFAFKDIFENFFAGILLLWRFPFENDDFIECEGIAGRVVDITVRLTLIRENSGELTVVPNSFLFKNPVKVLTNQSLRRIRIIVGVAYGEQMDEAIQVIEQALESCETVSKERPVQIFPQAFGSSSIDIEVAWWTQAQPVEERRSRGEVVIAIKAALDAAQIEIPFPYRTLTFKEPLTIEGHAGAES